MAHVELSLTGSLVPRSRTPTQPGIDANIDRWTATVVAAAEPCCVIDFTTTILAVSTSCCELLGLGDPRSAVGRPLVGGVLRLIDFTACRGELAEPETEKIPPLLALSTGRLARGLMRVQPNGHRGTDVTVDAISTPLWQAGRVTASLTFFSPVV